MHFSKLVLIIIYPNKNDFDFWEPSLSTQNHENFYFLVLWLMVAKIFYVLENSITYNNTCILRIVTNIFYKEKLESQKNM